MKQSVISKKNLLPFILVTSLFALWGFANTVTDPMVQAFKKILELTNAEASWVQMAFYGGYFCMALPASLFIRKYSYKVGVLIGLGLYAFGALLFFPAATTEHFWFFCLGLYILTFGLAFLETTANPYILAMGDPKTATQRLNLAQTFNPIGAIVGLLTAKYFILEKLQSSNNDYNLLEESKKILIKTSDLLLIRNTYVTLGLVILAVLVLFLVNKMPQIGNSKENTSNLKSTFSDLVKNKKYLFGVISQIFYVGAQIMCWTYIYQYSENLGISSGEAANYQFIAFILFLIGRAVGTALFKYMSSHNVLSLFAILASTCTVGTLFLENMFGLYCLIGITFFMSVIFPTIYGIALDGLSENTSKIAAAGLVMAIVGGALMPQIQGRIIDLGGTKVNDITILGVSEINFSFILPLICFLVIAFYGWWVGNLKD